MERLETEGEDSRRRAVERASALLRDGQLVGLPTETVYGVGARSDDPAAMERLRTLKGRGDKPFTLVFADAERALACAPAPTMAARRLAARYWPGPLTLVVDGANGESVGVRVPGHDVTREILAELGIPVALPSANLAGGVPALDAEETRSALDGQIAAVVDGARAPLGAASTVVRATQDRLEVLRPGVLSEADVMKTAIRSILFVCSGNTCRSPMAEQLLKRALVKRLNVAPDRLAAAGFRVASAGRHAVAGDPASDGARAAMAARDVDLGRHRSRPLTPALLDAQDRVFCMTARLADEIDTIVPGRVRLLDPTGGDVVDPFGGDLATYERCAAQLEQLIGPIADQETS